MRRNKGFTLIELMVVILIVAILAAVLAPMLSGRINQAKWTEGKAGAGTIATAVRAYIAEHEGTVNNDGATAVDIAGGISDATTFGYIGIKSADLTGKYFTMADYTVSSIGYNATTGACTYLITVAAPTGLTGTVTLNGSGVMTGPD